MTLKSFFQFSNEQRSGIFMLFTISIALQLSYFFIDFTTAEKDSKEKLQWLAFQTEVDSLKQVQYDYVPKIYPFNPNFITDFKGYKLGMSVSEIDRLLAYRKLNKYVNSAVEFQQVTKVSDSLLNAISPYFKFPDWVTNKSNTNSYAQKSFSKFNKKEKIVILDINLATQEDLVKVYGIGAGLSERILKQKEILGGFVSMEQMKDVWGLSPEVIESLNKSFKVSVQPKLKKVNVNNASVKDLSQFPYFRYALAKTIVTYRSMNGDIKTKEDLLKIRNFPVDKVDIIALYLDFN
ncbi:helix-hairpin-helix domain-containing protein [Flavobacterium sp. GT3R68]|uniref:ComEA family DNA-binding protein n=1 Tax=Flavobacterium sp. GT3R68 TaxID=2594437 RepID=UPI000F88CBC8|nr:helix-hairpin-helix domain-containing protein [Flavobacterium sp. GT3R68]RTY90263.1 helix-hairpin-helix domain-containing protein [Flavobacterium sp. GSN2]TRW90564.1 helix-hairpin-helix domain-containing protein [Flavobacterium sp. GT3R68]